MGLVSLKQKVNGEQFVVVGTTDKKVMKLYFSASDPQDLLKQFLLDNKVEEHIISKMIINAGYTKVSNTDSDEPYVLADFLPGVDLKAKHPVTEVQLPLKHIIIDLNDHHKWTREAIADWIENTFDTSDISFKIPEVNDEGKALATTTKLVTIERLL